MSQQTEQDMLRIMRDPALWAETHLGQKPRWYQEQALRHPHNRTVLRWGRRLGKCIAEGQRILNPVTGEYTKVEHLFKKQNVPMFTLDDHYKLDTDMSFRIEQNGVKPVFEVKTHAGAQVELTGNHPVLTLNGWVEVDDLKEGDFIAVPKELKAFGQSKPGELYARVLAYIVATHRKVNNGQTIQLTSDETRDELLDNLQSYDLPAFPKTAQTYFIVDKRKEFTDVLNAEQEEIPASVYTFDKEHLAIFLASLYDAKGWIHIKNVPEIGYGTTKQQFARDMKHLLLRFGIHVNIHVRNIKQEKYYQVVINNKRDSLKFIELIGQYSIRDYSRVKEKADSMEERLPGIPKEIWTYIDEQRIEKGLTKLAVTGKKGEKFRPNISLNEEKARKFGANLDDDWLQDLGNSDVYWQEVESIIGRGHKMTFDVSMPKYHNLVVEDICVHNTWTMTTHMLWAAFTNMGGAKKEGYTKCLVATPYDNQARLIFNELKKHIESNEVLEASVKRMTKNPYYIELKNGSTIQLFTAGTRTSAGGASIRGQAADMLYLDELDYMTDEDFQTIYAITFEAPERIGVMASSTPTGRRGTFYEICTQLKFNQDQQLPPINTKQLGYVFKKENYDRPTAEGWKEFYFPSMVNPEWSTKMERELKGQYSEVAYQHEVLAEFGTEMVGVFNKDYIEEASSRKYKLQEERRAEGPIAIGVDWDKLTCPFLP